MSTKYQRRKLAGLCVVCGTAPRGEHTVTCPACAERARRSDKARQRAALALGLCRACWAAEAVLGRGGMCASCADKNTARSAAWRAARANET